MPFATSLSAARSDALGIGTKVSVAICVPVIVVVLFQSRCRRAFVVKHGLAVRSVGGAND